MSTVDQFSAQIGGASMIIASIIGLFFNLSAFRKYLSLEKTSFHVMCISKTVSNSLHILVYLLYNGPSALLYAQLGPELLNRYLNQAIAYGLYCQGPLTQALITINRFLIVYFAPIVIPWYSKWITFGSLSACWIIAAYFSTLIGFPESCLIRFSHQSLTWMHDECPYFIHYILQSDFLFLVLPLAVFSNVMNVFIAIKLFLSSKTQNLSTESCRHRQKTLIRLFIQNCFEDWVYVLDTVNSLFFRNTANHPFLIFIVTLGSNLFTQLADGLVMYVSNYQRNGKRRVNSAKVQNTNRVAGSKQYLSN
ncbi:7TM GPCR serpentine receptor class x (Srx) domain-containing protein [Caenorhabditis elegans]|uniref:7TM GPCR serpentine receptor class x (Srx) domain-containing protein n=1 Tax=Caenorhabditis elegans TaxID=6239 RepID=O44877_CAEEL|nr:7TM GPCR serpentine receptor class x (Srx) domain-containing protein [Caenorhabditis elegans]CCD69331.1 7TM GPCR serpentine receptor class x (Srx) domain-containing protein [Caenorhabditis elegans]|eukprot:NP_494642.2 Serpentine Receptor, class X [Caenorhabditis elegans]